MGQRTPGHIWNILFGQEGILQELLKYLNQVAWIINIQRSLLVAPPTWSGSKTKDPPLFCYRSPFYLERLVRICWNSTGQTIRQGRLVSRLLGIVVTPVNRNKWTLIIRLPVIISIHSTDIVTKHQFPSSISRAGVPILFIIGTFYSRNRGYQWLTCLGLG